MKKYIWFLILILSISAAYLSMRYFDAAIPILNLEINTDKVLILDKAKEISIKYNLGPKDFRQIIYFNSEINIQNYIELELNGVKSTQEIIKNRLYYPYTWQVRHFQQNDSNECLIKFTHEGNFLGFIEHLSENQFLPSLTESQAKELIERFLSDEININLKDYTQVSSSFETRANGRIDQTFIYQRNSFQGELGNLNYRMILTVCGNKITVFNRYIEVPEMFNRKFTQLSLFGEVVKSFSSMFMYIIYTFFGCLLGLAYLIRKNWLIAKKSIIIGVILAFSEFIYKLNELPLIWIDYNTANPYYSHLINYLIGNFVLFLILIVIYSTSVAVAEGFTRLLFGHHLQFFKLLKPQVLSSFTLVKKSLIGYLIVPFIIGYILLFYTFGIKFFGWWSPSNSLINPNILSTYFPGLSVLAQSFRASFWEECLFRALPLSFFYFISRRYKYKGTILFLGLIIQAIIFAAGHASYLTIPGYVRLVELILPSIVFGVVYLKFGLFSVILIHFIYDAIFLSLPILASNNIIFEKLIIILGIFMPLLLPLVAFIVRKLYCYFINYNRDCSLGNLDKFYNKNWQPKVLFLDDKQIDQEPNAKMPNKKLLYILFSISVTLFGFSFWFIRLKPDMQVIKITKEQAISIAKNFLKEKNVTFDKSWSILTSIYHPEEKIIESKLIWQKFRPLYRHFVDLNYIYTPCYRIRLVKFEDYGSQKGQEYDIYISSSGKIIRYNKILPYDFPGKYLYKDQAKELATNFIVDEFKINKEDFGEVASKMIERKSRQDWEFVFNIFSKFDNGLLVNSNLDQGNSNGIIPQIVINISGSEITDAYKGIFIPQDWLRQEEYNKQLQNIVILVTGTLFLFFIAIAFLQFLNLFNDSIFKLNSTKMFFLICFVLSILRRFLVMPDVISNFSTSKPFLPQIISSELIALISIFAQIISMTLLFSVIIKHQYRTQIVNVKNLKNSLLLSFSLSFFILTASILLQYFASIERPIVVGFSHLNSYYPTLLYIIDNIFAYLNNVIYFIFVVQLTKYKFNFRSILIFLLGAMTLIPIDSFYSLSQWLILSGSLFIILLLIYLFIIRFDILLVPLIYNLIYQIILLKNYFISDYPVFFIAKLNILPTILSMFAILVCCLIIINMLSSKSNIYE